MSKVASYLAEHILGETSARPLVLAAYANDGSILEKRPEMVLYPRTLADIRKITTFCWQLAEKGHKFPITPRGSGKGVTGGAIGRGAVVDMSTHMHRIFEYVPKEALVRLQPGVKVSSLLEALSLRTTSIPLFRDEDPEATIGGIIAEGVSGSRRTKHGDINGIVSQLEIVLASGDVIQTGRISKREVNRKKGLDTFEGDVYRKLDALFEDKAELFASAAGQDIRDKAGYPGIFSVKQKNGSFDLTPLFIGSQGTLGFIAEMILSTKYAPEKDEIAALIFKDKATARDIVTQLRKFEPSYAEYIDGELVEAAARNGKRIDSFEGAGAVIVLGFDDVKDKTRTKKVKKLRKMFAKSDDVMVFGSDKERIEQLHVIRDIPRFAYTSKQNDESYPPLLDNFYVPEERREAFIEALGLLASKHGIELPLYGDVLTGIYTTRPLLRLNRIGDKQKTFKLIEEVGKLIAQSGGSLVGDGSEGRLHARTAHHQLDPSYLELYKEVKAIFDPYDILNPGVKQSVDLHDLVAMLRNEY